MLWMKHVNKLALEIDSCACSRTFSLGAQFLNPNFQHGGKSNFLKRPLLTWHPRCMVTNGPSPPVGWGFYARPSSVYTEQDPLALGLSPYVTSLRIVCLFHQTLWCHEYPPVWWPDFDRRCDIVSGMVRTPEIRKETLFKITKYITVTVKYFFWHSRKITGQKIQ